MVAPSAVHRKAKRSVYAQPRKGLLPPILFRYSIVFCHSRCAVLSVHFAMPVLQRPQQTAVFFLFSALRTVPGSCVDGAGDREDVCHRNQHQLASTRERERERASPPLYRKLINSAV